MFKFLKDMFGKGKEEGPLILRKEEVPPFLDTCGREGTETLYEKTAVHRKAVESLRLELLNFLDDLSSKEREEAYHPKLEKVAKNTLPLFRKSMLSSLTRDLPPDPEEFYKAAGECLKGCVKGLNGPGRYLQSVFPDEMKMIREAIDRVGKEMNAMTPAIAEARNRRGLVDRARHELSRYSAATEEKESSGIEIARWQEEVAEAEEDLARIGKEANLLESGPEAGQLAVLAESLNRQKVTVEAEERSIRGDLAVVSHVLRKGEKILQRSQGSAAAKGLEETVDLLAGSAIPDEDQLLPALERTLPLIDSMLKSGDITLKNKEEKEMFSPDKDVLARVKDDFSRLQDARSALRAAEHAYRDSPLLRKMRQTEEVKNQSEAHIRSLRGKISSAEERLRSLNDEIPDIHLSLEATLGELAGRKVEFVPSGEEELL
jgi:hypothetical protein